MQTHTYTVTTYDFDELSDKAKAKARDSLRDVNVDDSYWSEYILEDAKECAKIIGIDIDNIYFSGFSSQGDGACFTGRWLYKKHSAKDIRIHAPDDTQLHKIADALQAAAKPHFYQLEARVSLSGHYYHEYCTSVDVEDSDNWHRDPSEDTHDAVTFALREFMRWIYKRLENEYWDLQSDEQVTETIEANECQFTESGEFYA